MWREEWKDREGGGRREEEEGRVYYRGRKKLDGIKEEQTEKMSGGKWKTGKERRLGEG